nr:disease resistance protein RPV1-like [Ziziphus jujuba var. spinosa]
MAFEDIKNRVDSRLQGWKANLLSQVYGQAGKEFSVEGRNQIGEVLRVHIVRQKIHLPEVVEAATILEALKLAFGDGYSNNYYSLILRIISTLNTAICKSQQERSKLSKVCMATKTSSPKKYDVFLSLRGEDTRLNFTDHLYKALSDNRIFTFRDDKKLGRGKDVGPELLKAIEDSTFAIVVFSVDYASSTWCLIELAKIVECKKKLGLIVLPVFYHVEIEDVKEQTGKFGQAFAKHYKTDSEDEIRKVNQWREALTEVAISLEGWHIKERSETKVSAEIVKVVLKGLNLTFSTSKNDLVGMDSRMQKMHALLNITQSEVVLTVGIWGMAGIGKTTIAEHVKTEISDKFDACAFITNVREEFERNGIIHLQNTLYKYLLNHEANIQHVEMGRNVLRNRLWSRRVLIILDDVDKLEQIEDLVGSAEQQHGWLGPGSRVIVTTRNKHLLKTYGENNIREVNSLSDNEALQLFSRKAFKRNRPFDDFVNLSDNFVKYADGNPLALNVLGSFLFGSDMDKWKATLNKFNELQIRNSMESNNGKATSKKNPEQRIFHVLQISFDGLDDDQKEIFLDIACFFKGKEEYLGTEAVKGIFLNLPKNVELNLSTVRVDPILQMKDLRLLKFPNVHFPKCVGYLPNELRLF